MAPEGFKSEVVLLGQRWAICYVDGWIMDGKAELLGCSLGYSREIHLALVQSRESLIDTLIHECLHSYWRMLPALTDGLHQVSDPDEGEEIMIVTHTTAMIDLLRNNPWIKELL